MTRTLKSVLLPVLAGLAILALIGLVGSALFLLREAAAVHPVLGWVVAGLLALAVILLLVVPVVQLLRLPRALVRPSEPTGPRWDRYVRRYAERLVRNDLVREGYVHLSDLESALADGGRGKRLEEEVTRAVRFLDGKAQEAITRHAAAVFATTAVSQSGRLDTAIVLSAQVRMVKEVACVYYQRPTYRELVSLYSNVGASAFVAGEIQDSELLAVLGAPVTAGITSFLPVAGADPLISLLVNSLLDGSANGFLTLRIGVLTRRYAGLRLEGDRRTVARSASLEAAGLLGGVVSQGATRVATLTRKLVVQRAVKGTSKAAKGVAGAGASLFERILGLAGKAGAAAASETTSRARALQESLRFWETIASTAQDESGEMKPIPEPPQPSFP
jgi:hypothetical protein